MKTKLLEALNFFDLIAEEAGLYGEARDIHQRAYKLLRAFIIKQSKEKKLSITDLAPSHVSKRLRDRARN